MCYKLNEQYFTWLNYQEFDFQLLSFKKIKPDIKQLLDDIKEMKDGFTPATNENVSGSVSNKLLNLEKEHYELQE